MDDYMIINVKLTEIPQICGPQNCELLENSYIFALGKNHSQDNEEIVCIWHSR